jgi:hypothetical protein
MDASCVTITIAVTVSPCFAQGDQETSQELQRALEMQGLLGPCDSLDPKVCFDIYQRRMEQLPEHKPDRGWRREAGQEMFGKAPLPSVNLTIQNLGDADELAATLASNSSPRKRIAAVRLRGTRNAEYQPNKPRWAALVRHHRSRSKRLTLFRG